MTQFQFVNLSDASDKELAYLSDLYYEAKVVDSPRAYFAQLSGEEQGEILSFYRNGKFLKVLLAGELIGMVGHGVKPGNDYIVIFYLLLPEHRGKGHFAPMIEAFAEWCRERYPERKKLRANTEKTNRASIRSLENAGFDFLEERLEGPEGKTPFVSFTKPL